MPPTEDSSAPEPQPGTGTTKDARQDEPAVEGPKPGSPGHRDLVDEAAQKADENVGSKDDDQQGG